MHIYAQVLQPCAFSILVNLLLLSFMLHNRKLIKQIWHQALLTENHIADPAAGLPEVRRLENPPKPYDSRPKNLPGPSVIQETRQQTNKTRFEWTTSKQSSVIEEETWDPRRGENFTYFLIFLWFHVCERKLQRLEWCDFDYNRNMRALKFIRQKFNTVLQDCSISFYISIYVDDRCK